MQRPIDSLTETNSVILHDAEQGCWLRFRDPVSILATQQLDQVMPLLTQIQQAVDQGYYAAGFISYEASPAFDPRFITQAAGDLPLIWFGLYRQPEVMTLPDEMEGRAIAPHWQPSITPAQYNQAIAQIKRYIAQGDTYQVNYSLRLRSPFTHDAWAYFLQLMAAQESLYGAFVQLDRWSICCASPELFFQWNDGTLLSRPMKGTAPRGLTYKGDRHLAQDLRNSPKNQAENLMIVDMIRNDMGRIAQIGTVQVPSLFELEQYPTVWQMTSPVQCQTDASFSEIVQALFPCASITGAPKARTMDIIAELEDSPRGIYTGTIGWLTPQKRAQFNVAIRTVVIDRHNQQAEYGVGGGIVWDSVDHQEFEECCTKAQVLTQRRPTFDLLESLLWTPEQGYFLLDLHLQRLQTSAAYFAFVLDERAVMRELEAIASTLPPLPHKIRLRVSKAGACQIQAQPLPPQNIAQPLRVTLAQTPIDSSNPFLYHKTTHRSVYDAAQEHHPDCDDVLLWNERRELTESCIANLVVEWDGQWYTPPVTCGLLAGTFRKFLLQHEKVVERVIQINDLSACSRIFLVNSVRQMREVTIIRDDLHSAGRTHRL